VNNRTTRITGILKQLQEKGSASIEELAARFGVSHMTIRRDVGYLEREHQVRLFRGGAVFTGRRPQATGSFDEYRLDDEHNKNTSEKQKIGSFAATLIEPGDVVFVDAGTTTEYLVRALPRESRITVVCYSTNVLCGLGTDHEHEVILLGGRLHPDSGVFESPEAVQLLSRTRITKAFLSANGIEANLGVTCSNPCEVSIKQEAMRSSLKRYLLVDSQKIGRVFSTFFAEAGDFEMVITGGPLSDEEKEPFQSRGIVVTEV